jgi:hypothetical protein
MVCGGITMEQIILYKSCDGKIFDSERACLKHEQDIMNKTTDLRVYKKNRKRIYDLSNESDYNESYRVVIPNESALQDVKQIYHRYGFYPDIDSIGTWCYDEDNGRWVKRP